jgi:L-gulonolactone oxidase
LVKFHEMEYSIPRSKLPEALAAIVEAVRREGLRISFPVEVRVTGADDVPLSTSFGRESAYIAVHMYKGMEYERYFRLVESIVAPMNGRPHWGKIHFQGATSLRSQYDRFADFLHLRERLDPNRRFVNAYVERVLGL